MGTSSRRVVRTSTSARTVSARSRRAAGRRGRCARPRRWARPRGALPCSGTSRAASTGLCGGGVAWRGGGALHRACAAGVVGVELAQNAQQHTGDGALFEYARVLAHSVRPSAGPPRGGTLVRCVARACARGSGGARARRGWRGCGGARDSRGWCARALRRAAAAAERGAVPLRARRRRGVWRRGGVRVPRGGRGAPRAPLAGGLGGGTLLAVSGSGYGGGGGSGGAGLGTTASAARCRIGDASVPARRAAAGVLACATPRARAWVRCCRGGGRWARVRRVVRGYQRAHRVRALAEQRAGGGRCARPRRWAASRGAAVLGYLACRFSGLCGGGVAWRGGCAASRLRTRRASSASSSQNAQQHTGDGALFGTRACSRTACARALARRAAARSSSRSAGFGARSGGNTRCTASLARVRRCARLAQWCARALRRAARRRRGETMRCACSTATRCVAARRRSCTAWQARCTACTSRADSARHAPRRLARAMAAAAAAVERPRRRRRRHGAHRRRVGAGAARGGGRARVRDAARARAWVRAVEVADGHEFTSGGAPQYQRAHRVRALAPTAGRRRACARPRRWARLRAARCRARVPRVPLRRALRRRRGVARRRCAASRLRTRRVSSASSSRRAQHTGDGALFEYARALARSVRPSAGPPRGGARRGAQRGPRRARRPHARCCQFGAGAAVRATRASGVLVRCVAPPAAAGARAVPLRVLDGDAMCGGAAAFVYRVAGAVHRVTPSRNSAAARSSPSLARALAAAAVEPASATASAARCRIGDASVPARRAAAGVLACATPRARAPEYVAVEVAADGHEFTSGGAPRVPARTVSARSRRAAGGGQCARRVAGHGFARRAAVLGYLACRFGRALRRRRGMARRVRCIAPAHAAGVVASSSRRMRSSTRVTARSSSTRARSRTACAERWPAAAARSSRCVARALARAAAARALHCQFGAGAAVRATRASGVLVRCVTPPAAERGAVPLRVLDGDAVCGGAAAFVCRVAGAVHVRLAGGLGGGTLLAVSGSGYGGGGGGGGGAASATASAARCRIGDASVPARRAAAGVLACATPRAPRWVRCCRGGCRWARVRRVVRTLVASARTVSARSRRAAGRQAVRSSRRWARLRAARVLVPRVPLQRALRRRRGVARRRCAASPARRRVVGVDSQNAQQHG